MRSYQTGEEYAAAFEAVILDRMHGKGLSKVPRSHLLRRVAHDLEAIPAEPMRARRSS